VAPTERPPIRNYFLSQDPYEFKEPVSSAAGEKKAAL
jgi:hypothetical protein